MTSELQARSLVTLLKDKATALTDDEKAQVSAALTTAGFLQDDACAILATMNIGGTGKRRDAHDMLTFPHFVAEHEWELAEQNFDSAMQTFMQVLIHRLGCVNADASRAAGVLLHWPDKNGSWAITVAKTPVVWGHLVNESFEMKILIAKSCKSPEALRASVEAKVKFGTIYAPSVAIATDIRGARGRGLQ